MYLVHVNTQERRGLVNIEPMICNAHLPCPWGWCWREGRVVNYSVDTKGGGLVE